MTAGGVALSEMLHGASTRPATHMPTQGERRLPMPEAPEADLRTDDFDYDLPSGAIAQVPAEPRDSCRLLVLERATGVIEHRRFHDLPSFLRPGDLLVVNETRVIPARLEGTEGRDRGSRRGAPAAPKIR